jgi:hypothetical protein
MAEGRRDPKRPVPSCIRGQSGHGGRAARTKAQLAAGPNQPTCTFTFSPIQFIERRSSSKSGWARRTQALAM